MIALRYQGFSHTEMLEWGISRRMRYLDWAEDMNRREKEELAKITGR